MNLLAVDFGTKRMGLAWVDTGLKIVLPFGIITGKNLAEISQKLVNLIKTEKADKVIFGLPLTQQGEECANTDRVRNFVEDIKKNISAPVEFVDERFSSQAADQMGGEASRDEKSAMLILEDYLTRQKI